MPILRTHTKNYLGRKKGYGELFMYVLFVYTHKRIPRGFRDVDFVTIHNDDNDNDDDNSDFLFAHNNVFAYIIILHLTLGSIAC